MKLVYVFLMTLSMYDLSAEHFCQNCDEVEASGQTSENIAMQEMALDPVHQAWEVDVHTQEQANDRFTQLVRSNKQFRVRTFFAQFMPDQVTIDKNLAYAAKHGLLNIVDLLINNSNPNLEKPSERGISCALKCAVGKSKLSSFMMILTSINQYAFDFQNMVDGIYGFITSTTTASGDLRFKEMLDKTSPLLSVSLSLSIGIVPGYDLNHLPRPSVSVSALPRPHQ